MHQCQAVIRLISRTSDRQDTCWIRSFEKQGFGCDWNYISGWAEQKSFNLKAWSSRRKFVRRCKHDHSNSKLFLFSLPNLRWQGSYVGYNWLVRPTNGWLQMVGYNWLVTNGWLQMVGYKWLVSNGWLNGWLQIAGYKFDLFIDFCIEHCTICRHMWM